MDEYQQSIDYLFSQLPMFSRVGGAAYKPGLERVEKLDAFFGHPHSRYPAIHIAGTNGKGSTSHLIASVLQAAGMKVGLYTSPHLADFRERIKVNGEMISRDGVVDFVNRFKSSGYDGDPSFFELTMMMAFDWFARQQVDIAVIEVGMGGRLDSTNIITPLLSVITNISWDHTQFLGDTLQKIAGEKAGIIKHHIPVVIGERQEETTEVFMAKAATEEAPIIFASDNEDAISLTHTDQGDWCVTLPSGKSFTCPLGGDYQRCNITTALHALRRIPGITISEEVISQGVESVITATGLMGRWMKVGEHPTMICDTGHNLAGITFNMGQLQRWQQQHPTSRLLMVIGFVADKDVDHILPLFPKNAEYFFSQAGIPRAMKAEVLAQKATAASLHGDIFCTVPEAVKAAQAKANPDDLIFIGGSTFIVADYLASK
jgi:dihydrofolate synthase/folylpolyglutamate synthase